MSSLSKFFSVLIHIFSCLFLWDPCFRFLWVLLVPYLIGQYILVYWQVALYIHLSCSFPPRTTISTLVSFGNYPFSSCPWSWALRQLMARFPWNYSGFPTFFLVVFLCLPLLLDLSVLFLVWLLMLSEGVGVWPACVSSPISSNVSLGRLLVGVLLSLFSDWWELCTLGSVLLIFILAWLGFWSGYLSQNVLWSGFWSGYLSQIFVNDLPSKSILLYFWIILENSTFLLLLSSIEFLGTITSRKYVRVDVDLGDTMESSKLQ